MAKLARDLSVGDYIFYEHGSDPWIGRVVSTESIANNKTGFAGVFTVKTLIESYPGNSNMEEWVLDERRKGTSTIGYLSVNNTPGEHSSSRHLVVPTAGGMQIDQLSVIEKPDVLE